MTPSFRKMRIYMMPLTVLLAFFCADKILAIEDEYLGLPTGGDCIIGIEPEEELARNGYATDEHAMKQILTKSDDVGVIYNALELISKRKYKSLVPDVKVYHASIARKFEPGQTTTSLSGDGVRITVDGYQLLTEGRRMRAIEAIFTNDTTLSKAERDYYMQEVRFALFERTMPNGKNPSTVAFHALIAAHVFQAIDIEEDIISLIEKERFQEGNQLATRCLFKYYGDQLSEDQLRSILTGIKKGSPNYMFFLKLANQRGKLMELEPFKKPVKSIG